MRESERANRVKPEHAPIASSRVVIETAQTSAWRLSRFLGGVHLLLAWALGSNSLIGFQGAGAKFKRALPSSNDHSVGLDVIGGEVDGSPLGSSAGPGELALGVDGARSHTSDEGRLAREPQPRSHLLTHQAG